MTITRYLMLLLLFLTGFGELCLNAQDDDKLRAIEQEIKNDSLLKRKYEDMTFYITQMLERRKRGLQVEGYIDAYYAFYTDSVGAGNFQKIPSISPRSSFGLNYLLLAARYSSDKFRSTIVLQYGDVAKSCWDPVYNLIQEANIGIRVLPKLWLDAGFFRTHLGVESIQPRENISMSLASTTFYDPYYLSGAKLTYYVNDYWTLQFHVFNSYNNYIDTNHKKTLGWSAHYQKGSHFVSANGLLTDESPDSALRPQTRYYQNVYWAYKSKTWDLSAEGNFGVQQNTKLSDPTRPAYFWSLFGVARYKFNTQHALYSRFETCHDNDQMLTGPVWSDKTTPVGLNLWGFTAGYEFKPMPNSYFRIESRMMQTDSNEKIFYWNGKYTNQRYELITALGIWF